MLNTDWSDAWERPRALLGPTPPPAPPDAWETPALPSPAAAPPDAWGASPAPSAPAGPAPAGAPAPGPGLTPASVLQSTGVAPVLSPSAMPAVGGPSTAYQTLLASLRQAVDPASFLVAQDRLARTVAADLTAGGHDVTWGDDGVLVVDGRSYEVGPGPAATGDQSVPRNEPPGSPPPGSPPPPPGGTPDGTPPPPGSSSTWSLQDAESFFLSPRLQTKPASPAALGELEGHLKQFGVTVLRNASGQISGKIRLADGTVVDVGYAFASGDPSQMRWQWVVEPSHADRLRDTLETSATSPAATFSWGQDPTSQAADRLWQSLFESPDAISPHMIEQLQARDAEQQIEAAASADEALRRFGHQAGYTDSPWLASERAETARDADANIIQNRRLVEVAAAEMNAKQRLSVASQAAQYFGLRLDAARFNQLGDQFQRDLLFRLLSLAQQDEQFAAQLGLSYDALNQDAWQHWWDTVGT